MRPAPERAMDDAERQTLLAPPFSPHAFIETDKGTVEIELAILDAPLTVSNFVALARKGFFNGIAIHRVVPDFVVQDGDPRGDGEGGPGYTIRDELNQQPYLRGTVGMALDWQDTGGSQFFITHSPQPHLDARYTVFGHVVNGIEVVDRIQPWDVIRRVQIWDGTHASLATTKGTPRRPLLCEQRTYLFFAAFFFPPFAFFAMRNPSLQLVWIAASCRSVRRTLPPGTLARSSATSLRGLTPDAPAANQESSNSMIDR